MGGGGEKVIDVAVIVVAGSGGGERGTGVAVPCALVVDIRL